jgi:lysine biosynthesis protein LysW
LRGRALYPQPEESARHAGALDARKMSESTIACRSCGRRLRFRRAPRLGQQLVCPKCGTRLEVIGVTPLEVDWAFDAPIDEASSEVVSDDLAGEPGLAVF